MFDQSFCADLPGRSAVDPGGPLALRVDSVIALAEVGTCEYPGSLELPSCRLNFRDLSWA